MLGLKCDDLFTIYIFPLRWLRSFKNYHLCQERRMLEEKHTLKGDSKPFPCPCPCPRSYKRILLRHSSSIQWLNTSSVICKGKLRYYKEYLYQPSVRLLHNSWPWSRNLFCFHSSSFTIGWENLYCSICSHLHDALILIINEILDHLVLMHYQYRCITAE